MRGRQLRLIFWEHLHLRRFDGQLPSPMRFLLPDLRQGLRHLSRRINAHAVTGPDVRSPSWSSPCPVRVPGAPGFLHRLLKQERWTPNPSVIYVGSGQPVVACLPPMEWKIEDLREIFYSSALSRGRRVSRSFGDWVDYWQLTSQWFFTDGGVLELKKCDYWMI